MYVLAHPFGDELDAPSSSCQWHRMPTTQETDGFQVKRPGDLNVKCTLLLMLDHQPPQYKLDPRLARLLGVHTQTRAAIMQALWLYIKHNQLQDGHEREYINCNRYFRQVSGAPPPLSLGPCPACSSTAPPWLVLCHLLHTAPGRFTAPCARQGVTNPLAPSPDLQLRPTPFL